jgi:hypothetical protein
MSTQEVRISVVINHIGFAICNAMQYHIPLSTSVEFKSANGNIIYLQRVSAQGSYIFMPEV